MTRQQRSTTRRRVLTLAGSSTLVGLAGCFGESTDENDDPMDDDSMDDDSMDDGMEPSDPDSAPRVAVDRFSDAAGTLHVRSSANDLPGPDDPIDFDEQFLVTGYGPDGEVVQYYDFDVMPTTPAPIYAFFYENGDPVADQRNVIGVVPGDEDYNDFWHVHTVTVPDDYQANGITSVDDLDDTDYGIEATETIKNCPVVPEGSTASMRHDDDESSTDPVDGWYDGEIASYFLFEEHPLEATDGMVPLSPIFVTFNANPGEDGGGPPSGFMTEADSDRTHNVPSTLPGDDTYSPLWDVSIYDNADFDTVSDLDSALDAALLESGAARVNCPIVSVS